MLLVDSRVYQGTASLTAAVSLPPISHRALALTTAGIFQNPRRRRGITVPTLLIGRCVLHQAGAPRCATEIVSGHSYPCFAPLTAFSVARAMWREMIRE